MEDIEKTQEQPVNSNEVTGAVTEKVEDEKDPIETLRQIAEELGVKDVKLLTEKELRSLIDKEISRAIKTREENIRKEEERKRLQEQGKFEEILKLERLELLESLKQSYVENYQLPSIFTKLIDVKSFIDMPVVEGKQALLSTFQQIKEEFDKYVEEKLAQRISELQRNATKITDNINSNDVKNVLKERFKNFG